MTEPHIVVAIACIGAAVIFSLIALVMGLPFTIDHHDDDNNHPPTLFPPF